MIADFPEFEPLELPDLDFEPLSLDFEALMFETEPLPVLELPEYEPIEFEPYEIELPTIEPLSLELCYLPAQLGFQHLEVNLLPNCTSGQSHLCPCHIVYLRRFCP